MSQGHWGLPVMARGRQARVVAYVSMVFGVLFLILAVMFIYLISGGPHF
jgi:hypothetical protein